MPTEPKEPKVRHIIRLYNLTTETMFEWWTKPMTATNLSNLMRNMGTSVVYIEGALNEIMGTKDYWDTLILTPAMQENPNLLISWGVKGR